MPTIAVRVWLPDRPGALALAASRIGAVGGDVVGIEILERGDGVVVDELVVELPDAVGTNQLAAEISGFDELTIEDIRTTDGPRDTVTRALELARVLVSAANRSELLDALVRYALEDMRAEWAAVVDRANRFASSAGPVPPARWVIRFAQGVSNRPLVDGSAGLDTVAVPVPAIPGALVVHRPQHPLLTAELRQLRLLIAIAGTCHERLQPEPGCDSVTGPAAAPCTQP